MSPPLLPFAVSLLLAGLSITVVRTPHLHQILGLDVITWSFLFTVSWLGLTVVSLVVYRKRALWLLLGAPIALAFPALFGNWVYMCRTAGPCY